MKSKNAKFILNLTEVSYECRRVMRVLNIWKIFERYLNFHAIWDWPKLTALLIYVWANIRFYYLVSYFIIRKITNTYFLKEWVGLQKHSPYIFFWSIEILSSPNFLYLKPIFNLLKINLNFINGMLRMEFLKGIK